MVRQWTFEHSALVDPSLSSSDQIQVKDPVTGVKTKEQEHFHEFSIRELRNQASEPVEEIREGSICFFEIKTDVSSVWSCLAKEDSMMHTSPMSTTDRERRTLGFATHELGPRGSQKHNLNHTSLILRNGSNHTLIATPASTKSEPAHCP